MIAAHQLRAAQRRELLNVAFYRNAQRLRRLKDALSLLRAEADVFAEDVNAFKQSLLPQRRQNGLADQRNIAVSIALIFRRRGVGGEQRRRQFHAIMIGQLSGDPQHFAFVWQVEAVAGFDLHVVTPSRSRRSRRGWASASSSASPPSRVARTVELMPPPLALMV